ncbi:MAG: hypothetical protein CVU01_02875 [Bacteroidetes bacterium HGW-Bacteroidetes-18]|nr:MAG: hypothetical protein CVU01_02875 [Bacteroidetes bacterium HGW-Bacteroidetes-18]
MSGTTGNLDNTKETVDTSNDSIVVINNLETIPGGKTLNVTGFTPTVIKAGHIIIEETSSGILKPMPVDGADYAALPASHTYKGVLIASILTTKPFAAVLVRGSVNKIASPYAVPAGAITALPLIRFTKD